MDLFKMQSGRIARDVDADYDRQYSTATLIPGQRYLNMPQPYLIIRSIQIINAGTRTFIQPRDTSFLVNITLLTHKVSLNTMEIGMKM
jgi:hypothetical protein